MTKLSLKIGVCFILSSLTTGCVPVVIGGAAAAGGFFVGQDDRRLGTITNDASITAEINGRYVKDDLVKARDINVDTYDGVVTLYGTVSGQPTREKAILIANQVLGVKSVVSKLDLAR